MKKPNNPKRQKPIIRKLGGKTNFRTINNICNTCLSSLKTLNGKWLCTGDKLKIWEKDFLKFQNLTMEEKVKYLNNTVDSDKFENLYNHWKVNNTTESNNYSEKYFISNEVYKTQIPDPMFIGKIEKNLGRELTENERYGIIPIWRKNGKYSDIYEEGAKQIEIPQIWFPDDG